MKFPGNLEKVEKSENEYIESFFLVLLCLTVATALPFFDEIDLPDAVYDSLTLSEKQVSF